MDPQQMAEWAYSFACEKCHSGEECEVDQCLNASEVSDFLKRVERFKGTDERGTPVRGWFVPDRV
jgi:hypothetical protein